MRRRPDARWNTLWLVCLLAAFHPNCARCCPQGLDGCSCKYAWEDCPASNNGCSSCSSTKATTGSVGFEAGTNNAQALEPSQDQPGGTIAFVPSPTGAFVVSSVTDSIHVVHVEATTWDEDPLTLRTIGDIALTPGDEPGRIVASQTGRAHAVLRRGGAVVAIDPSAPKIVDRTKTCAEPHGLAYDAAKELVYVACTSGEIITLGAADTHEVSHRFVDSGLEDIAVGRDAIVAATRNKILRIAADGTLEGHEARGTIGALRSTSGDVALAFTNDNASFATVTSEGSIGPFMAVRPTSHVTSDLDVAPDATVGIVSDGDAFLLRRGEAAFTPVGAPGIARAIAIGEIATPNSANHIVKRRVIAVRTDAPRMIVFFDMANPPVMLGFETL